MHHSHFSFANSLCILESVAEDSFARCSGNEFDALHYPIYHDMLDARVLSFGVLPDQDRINIVVQSLVAFNGATGSYIGEKIKRSA